VFLHNSFRQFPGMLETIKCCNSSHKLINPGVYKSVNYGSTNACRINGYKVSVWKIKDQLEQMAKAKYSNKTFIATYNSLI